MERVQSSLRPPRSFASQLRRKTRRQFVRPTLLSRWNNSHFNPSYGAWKCPQQGPHMFVWNWRGGKGGGGRLGRAPVLTRYSNAPPHHRNLQAPPTFVGGSSRCISRGAWWKVTHAEERGKEGGGGLRPLCLHARTDERNRTDVTVRPAPVGYEKSGAQFRQLRQGLLDSWYLLPSFHGPPLPASWEPPAPTSSHPTACLFFHPSSFPWLWVA